MELETFIQLDATDLSELVQNKEIKQIELLDLSFQQLEKVNPLLNGVINTRKEKAMEEIKRMKTINLPFAGVPMLLKDISQKLQGEVLTSGSKLLKSAFSDRDSHLVKKLREAGFQFAGHTNTPEFGLKNITRSEEH